MVMWLCLCLIVRRWRYSANGGMPRERCSGSSSIAVVAEESGVSPVLKWVLKMCSAVILEFETHTQNTHTHR